MVKSSSDPNVSPRDKTLTKDNIASHRLRAEATAPYRSLRRFIYLACAASASIGSFVFFFKLLAGREIHSTLPNLALQVGVLALMIWLFRLDQPKQ